MTTPATRLVGLLGHPVAHSASPELMSAAAAAAGVDLAYVAFDVRPHDLPAAVAGLRALGAVGVNVTVPHKQEALRLADRASPAAEATGAANTLCFDDVGVVAENTDVGGLGDVLDGLALEDGAPVLLLGAGGAARAAAWALGSRGHEVEVLARRAAPAAEVAALVELAGGRPGAVTRPTLLVNATPLGLHGEALPERLMEVGRGQIALDLTYAAEPSPFLEAAAARGAVALDGRGMLVGQACRAFTLWTGAPASAHDLRRVLDGVLADRRALKSA